MADMELIESIRRVEQDIRESRSRVKDGREELQMAVSELSESGVLVEALSEVKIAREKLKLAIGQDPDCRAARDGLEAENAKLRDLRDILSLHLVRYRETSAQAFVQEEDSAKVRPIIMSAKLGKAEYQQESLFDDKPEPIEIHEGMKTDELLGKQPE